MTGVILAGISGAGKTTVHKAVTASLAAAGRQTLVSVPQAMTTTAHLYLAGNPALQADAVVTWLEEMTAFAACLTGRACDGGLTVHREAACWTPAFVLKGFVYDIPLHDLAITRGRVAGVERRLAGLGFTLVLLTVPPDRIQEQCVASTREHRGAGWAAHLEKLGSTDAGRADALGGGQPPARHRDRHLRPGLGAGIGRRHRDRRRGRPVSRLRRGPGGGEDRQERGPAVRPRQQRGVHGPGPDLAVGQLVPRDDVEAQVVLAAGELTLARGHGEHDVQLVTDDAVLGVGVLHHPGGHRAVHREAKLLLQLARQGHGQGLPGLGVPARQERPRLAHLPGQQDPAGGADDRPRYHLNRRPAGHVPGTARVFCHA